MWDENVSVAGVWYLSENGSRGAERKLKLNVRLSISIKVKENR